MAIHQGQGAKLWGGRFESGRDSLAEQFNASIEVDHQFLEQDVAGSIAHSKMLCHIGVLTVEEQEKIEKGLMDVKEMLQEKPELFSVAHEDIHMNIEWLLTKQIGSVAKKLHTARSRNDQVALDFKLYLRDQNQKLQKALLRLMSVLLELSKAHKETLMPGYTHLQRAQPITLGFHLLTYVYMFERDLERLREQFKRLDQMPLGAGALAGLPYPIDREMVKELLGFKSLALHAMDAVSDRDYAIEFLATGATMQMHFSRLAEELILWSSSEFGYIRLAEAYCTGSSIMPQKRNPDVAELIRGKTGRVYGNLFNLLTTLKALPLAYNKDLQEDKAPVMDTASQLLMITELMARMLETANFHKEKMAQAVSLGYLNATDLADYWVSKGMAFREAHSCSGASVKLAESLGVELKDLDQQTFRGILTQVMGEGTAVEKYLGDDLYEAIELWFCVKKKASLGSTAILAVEQMIAEKEMIIEQYHIK